MAFTLVVAGAALFACGGDDSASPGGADAGTDTGSSGSSGSSGTDASPGMDAAADVDAAPPETCTDNVKNGTETGKDCGGSCPACALNEACSTGKDCTSNYCSAAGKCALPRDCADLLTRSPSLPSGKYQVDVDGAGALAPMTVECDMVTEGGGWMLVLNYLHKIGTNPALTVRTTTLPVVGVTTLGTDESAVAASWGHAGNALMTALTFDEMRWVGRTSAHARVIDFVTSAPDVRTYVRTGTGTANVQIFDPQYTRVLAGRVNSTLPLHVAPNDRHGNVDQGDLAMTQLPFYGSSAIENPSARWAIHGTGDTWEADDDVNDTANGDTHHQVWVRPASCKDTVKNLGESDVDCGGSCGGCAVTKACAKDSDCKSGSCVATKCAATLQTSCKTLLAAHAGIASGVYTIDPDGAGAIAPFDAYCDMKFDSGGWTMVLSTAYGSDPASSTEGVVLTGTTSNMPPATLTALAGLSTQTHVRTHATQVLRSVTSKAGTMAITRLGALGMLESGASGPGDLADWTGPFADLTHLEFTCPTSSGTWPSVYQSCGTDGMHLWTGQSGHSRWNWLGGNRGLNEPMELYVR